MSDNQGKRLENLGWEKMNALLDKEMPVEKSPRRLLAWWWIAAGFALLVLGISFFPLTKDQVHLAGRDHQTTSTDIANNSSDTKTAIETSEKPASNNHVENQEVKVISKTSSNQLEEATKKVMATQMAGFEKKRSEKTFSESNAIPPSAITKSELPDAENRELAAKDLSKGFSTIVPEMLSSRALIAVSTAKTKELSAPGVSLTKPITSEKMVEWSIQGGLITENFSLVNGVDGSFLASFPLKSRWRINTGLGVAFLNKLQVKVNSTDTLEYGRNQDYDPNQEGVRAISEPRESFIEEKSFLLVEVPVLAEYFITPTWTVYGGIKNSFLLPGTAAKESSQVELTTTDTNTFTNQIFTASYTYPNYTLSGVIGTRYRFSNLLFGWGQYQHAMHFEKSPVGFQNNRFTIGAGISF